MAILCAQCGVEIPREEWAEAARLGYRAGHQFATKGLGTGLEGGLLLGMLGAAFIAGLVRHCKACLEKNLHTAPVTPPVPVLIPDLPVPPPSTAPLPRSTYQEPMDLYWSTWQRGKRPQDHIRTDIPRADRELVAAALRGGERMQAWLGYANCRLCGVQLGTCDLGGYGFLWPEQAEHYILEHDVWTPDCAVLRRLLGEKS